MFCLVFIFVARVFGYDGDGLGDLLYDIGIIGDGQQFNPGVEIPFVGGDVARREMIERQAHDVPAAFFTGAAIGVLFKDRFQFLRDDVLHVIFQFHTAPCLS